MYIQCIPLKLSQVHFLGMSLITYKKKYKTYKCLVYISCHNTGYIILCTVFTSIGQFPLLCYYTNKGIEAICNHGNHQEWLLLPSSGDIISHKWLPVVNWL